MCWLCMSYASVQHLMEGGYICVQKCSVNTHRESKLIHCCGWNNIAIKCLTAESPLSYPWQLFTFLSSWCRGLPNYNVAIFSSPPLPQVWSWLQKIRLFILQCVLNLRLRKFMTNTAEHEIPVLRLILLISSPQYFSPISYLFCLFEWIYIYLL